MPPHCFTFAHSWGRRCVGSSLLQRKRCGCGLPLLVIPTMVTCYSTQNNYFWPGFHKWPNTLSWGSVSILVTPVFGHKKEFIYLNVRKVFGDLFQRSHNSVSLLLQFCCNSKHLKTWFSTICNVLLWCWGKDSHSALKAHHIYETLGYPSNADFESVLQAGGIGGCTLTAEDARVAHKIWGDSVSSLKGSTVRETGKRKPQSLVKVPCELIQL